MNMDRLAVCYGKEPLTWELAVSILGRSKDRKRGMYHCRFCKAWHLGRKPKSARRQRDVEMRGGAHHRLTYQVEGAIPTSSQEL